MRRIGIFGGSFNPIHNGHLHLAKTAMEQFSLDHVLFMPTYISPFKQNAADVADSMHRLAMCRLAIAPYPCFSVSDYELQQKTVSYTIHTISALRQEWTDVELVLLMGSDMLLQFQNWYHWQELLTMTELGVIARETDDRVVLEQAAQELSAYGTIQLCCVAFSADDPLPDQLESAIRPTLVSPLKTKKSPNVATSASPSFEVPVQ